MDVAYPPLVSASSLMMMQVITSVLCRSLSNAAATCARLACSRDSQDFASATTALHYFLGETYTTQDEDVQRTWKQVPQLVPSMFPNQHAWEYMRINPIGPIVCVLIAWRIDF
jgi:hypothetical protein